MPGYSREKIQEAIKSIKGGSLRRDVTWKKLEDFLTLILTEQKKVDSIDELVQKPPEKTTPKPKKKKQNKPQKP